MQNPNRRSVCTLEYNDVMIKFSSFLTEDKGGKNLHLEHIEDEILNYGITGGRSSINFVRSLRDMLAGKFTFINRHDCEVGWCACNFCWY